MLKKTLILAFVALALCHAANFTSTHGKLKVEGGKIKNTSNQDVVLRGMSLYWYNGPWGGGQPGNQFYNEQVVKDLADNWGASVIRAAIGDKSVSVAKDMMKWAKTAGIYVIIDNHSHTAHNETDAVKNFFRDVSQEVKNNNYTHVIYELYNEPQAGTTWAQIKTFANEVIPVIRANDPDGLIVVGTPAMSSNIGAAKSDPITGTNAKNVLYTLHFYAGEGGHGLYKDALKSAYCADLPVFVTEWGTTPASGNGTVSESGSNSWISLLEAAKVSHANWSLSNAGESSAALTGNSLTGGLTQSGTYVKNLMKLNSGASLSSVGLTAQTIDCSGPPEPTGPDGRIQFGYSGSMLNFASKNGADSAVSDNVWSLVNTSNDFSADYTLFNIPGPGTYLIVFNFASNAAGTVSWSGSGIESGEIQYQSTDNKFKSSEIKTITIKEAPETQLHISFQTPSANSVKARSFAVMKADSADSVNFEIPSTPTPVLKYAKEGKSWTYNAAAKAFYFEREGTLSIVNLRGERVKFFEAKGAVYLKELPAGVYIAVYRHGSETAKKTIYLK